MASSVHLVEDIGKVKIYRRRGLKNIRITVEHDGSVRLSIPWYVSKSAGLRYLFSKKSWVKQHQDGRFKGWQDGQRLTKDYVLKVVHSDVKTKSKPEDGVLTVTLPAVFDESKSQELLDRQITKFLRKECEQKVVPRLLFAAKNDGFEVKDVKIKKLKSRWGSCNHEKVITLNLSLVQLPDELSEYVIYHELAHTSQLNHGKEVWLEVAKAVPDYKERRKTLRKFNPAAIS